MIDVFNNPRSFKLGDISLRVAKRSISQEQEMVRWVLEQIPDPLKDLIERFKAVSGDDRELYGELIRSNQDAVLKLVKPKVAYLNEMFMEAISSQEGMRFVFNLAVKGLNPNFTDDVIANMVNPMEMKSIQDIISYFLYGFTAEEYELSQARDDSKKNDRPIANTSDT